MTSLLDIELASYVSWPAFEQVDYGDWVLRFADGYTKRANSVNAIAPCSGDVAAAVAYCESLYKTRKLPTIFRLLSFVEDSALDRHLADAGYTFIDPSLILYQALDHEPAAPEIFVQLDRTAWLKVFCDVAEVDPARQSTHTKILDRVPASSLFVSLEDQGQPVACGLGVVHEGFFGIFDIVTRKQERQKGYGTQLINTMLGWAYRNGARHAYTQVVANNAPAIRLYEKLGYWRLYHYWYRIQRTGNGS